MSTLQDTALSSVSASSPAFDQALSQFLANNDVGIVAVSLTAIINILKNISSVRSKRLLSSSSCTGPTCPLSSYLLFALLRIISNPLHLHFIRRVRRIRSSVRCKNRTRTSSTKSRAHLAAENSCPPWGGLHRMTHTFYPHRCR